MNMIIVWFYFITLYFKHEQNEIKNILYETSLYAYTYVCGLWARKAPFGATPDLTGCIDFFSNKVFEKIIRTYYHNYLKCCICNQERSCVLKPHLGKVLGWSGWRERRRRVGWLWRLALLAVVWRCWPLMK